MTKTTMRLVMAAGAMLVATTGLAQTPRASGSLTATFQCPTSAGKDCRVIGDALGPYSGYDTVETCTINSKTGKKTCTYAYDGAFINTDGGLDVNLISGVGAVERRMSFSFADSRNIDKDGKALQPPCGLTSSVTATKVDFRFNASPLDVELMVERTDLADFPGSINFMPENQTPVSNVFLKFGPIAAGSKSLVRVDDGDPDKISNTWTLTFDAKIEVVCTTKVGGRLITTSAGYYWMPFQMTLAK